MHDVEIAQIERFLLEDKMLSGNAPPWQENGYRNMWQFRWGVLDSIGVEYAELCFTTNRRQDEFTISLIVRKKMVHRIDVIPTGPLTGKFPRIYKKEIDDFRVKTKFLALQLNNFETFLNPEIPLSDDWPQPLRDIFLQAISYPPQAGHPQYRNYKGLLAQIEPSRP